MLSKRIQRIKSSGIRKVFNLALSSKQDFINLSIGQPHFKTPLQLKEAVQKAILNDYNSYTPTMGLTSLREKIAQKLKIKNNINAKTEEVMITSGVAGGIFLAFSALLNSFDEVILPDPYFVLYRQVLDYLNVKTVLLDTYPSFHINAEELKKKITKKTKMIILNSPNNPTGVVYTKEEIKDIVSIAKKNNIFIFSDEIYENFDYEKKFFSPASIYDKTITVNGFSKSHSITGWRVGYLHANQKIIQAINKLQQYTFVCAPSFAQVALLKSFEIDLSVEYEKYKQKRNYVYDNLIDKYEFNKTEGAFYAFIKNPKTKKFFHKELLKNNILSIPGNVFSKKSNYFRISFAVSDSVLKKGIAILRKLI